MSAGNLPGDILEDIFCRLPVKSLIILTVICKSWRELICSPSFMEIHLSRFSVNPQNHSLLLHQPCHDTVTILPLTFSGIAPTSTIHIPVSESTPNSICPEISETPPNLFVPMQLLQQEQTLRLRLVGSVNGLVCLSRPTLRPTNVVIWNPATHKFKDILVPHLSLNDPYRIYVAFGFDSVVNDYKVVCIYRFRLRKYMEMSFRFRMYSCNANSWKEFEPDFPFHMDFISECVTVNGNPYCIGYYKKNAILVYVNVGTEAIHVFSLPEYAGSLPISSIMDMGHSVARIVYSLDNLIDVYTLEENSGVWTKMYTMESTGLQKPLRLQCYKTGKFVLKDFGGKLFVYDLVSKEIKDFGIGGGSAVNYTESLVAIEGMERVAEETGQETALTNRVTLKLRITALTTSDRDALDAVLLEGID